MSFVFQISIKDNGVALLLGTLDVITHMVMQVGAFAATSCFLAEFLHSKNKCARECFGTIQYIFVILFLDFVACP